MYLVIYLLVYSTYIMLQLQVYYAIRAVTKVWNQGSLHVSGKLSPYPSPKPTFCPKRGVIVNVGLGEG